MDLTREQTQTILNNAKAQGLSTKSVLDGLIQRGYNIEGVDSEAAKVAIARETPPVEQTRGQETVEDIKQIGTDVVTSAKERSSNLGESIEDYKKGEQGLGRTIFQGLGQAAGFAGDVTGNILKGGVKAVLSQEGEETLKGGVKTVAEPLVSSEPVQNIIKYYQSLDPKMQRDLDATFGIGSLVFDVATAGAGGAAVKTGTTALKTGAKNIVEGAVDTTLKGATKFADTLTPVVAKGVGALKSPAPTAIEATGKVLQGATKDIAPAIKGLSALDTTGVKTFKELGSTISNKITELAGVVDTDLAVDTTKRILKDLVVKGKTLSGKIVNSNPVETALKQLSELYTKIGDNVSAANIMEALNRAKKEGITNLDINNLARNYGEEFGRKAFGKLGEPLTSVNAQLYENTRKALKTLARQGINGPAAKKADEIMSSLYNTKTLVTRSVEAVNKLQQRINERGLLEKIGHGFSKYSDLLTGGTIRGVVGGLLPRGAGYKVMNALDIEAGLEKNLKIIQEAIKAGKDADIVKILKKLDDFNSPTVGQTVNNFERAKGLSNLDTDIETKAFDKITRSENEILQKYYANNRLDPKNPSSPVVVNADNFRPDFIEEGYRGYNAAAVQEPSSYLAKRAYTEQLKNPGQYVIGTGGGSGAGKSTALKGVSEYVNLTGEAALILDSNLSSFPSALKKIKEAEAAGKKFVEFFTYRDPREAFDHGVVKRMLTNDKEMGRLVPSKVVAQNHIDSLKVARELEKNGLKVYYVDNSLGAGNARVVSFDELAAKAKDVSIDNLKKELDLIAKKLYNNGKITKEQYQGYIQ